MNTLYTVGAATYIRRSFYYWSGNWNHPKFRGDSSFWVNGTDAEIL